MLTGDSFLFWEFYPTWRTCGQLPQRASTTEPSAVAPDVSTQLGVAWGSGATALGSVVDAGTPAVCIAVAKSLSSSEDRRPSTLLVCLDNPTYYLASMNPDEFRAEHIPLGYLITIRAYGTWLHGTAGSVDRFHNRYGTPRLPASEKRRQYNRRLLVAPPITLGPKMRKAIELGIKETCEIRKWSLWALNARTNHVHSVVSATCKPKKIVTAFKANATRKMRESCVWSSERSPWVSGGGSKKYLWTERAMTKAIAYVLYEQGEPLLE